ncbi:MAG: penicillin-binding transpeptidase domain-containing protein [Planctomycetes bacterium]|jgi:penicillin-binding protein 2|nr:penicillin-binding transpeptidase domain-containing protein [Planctomycetota bacterium]
MGLVVYENRVKVFLGVSLAVLLVCIVRLAQLQLSAPGPVQAEIDQLKELGTRARQFQTLRGKILDRRGATLAADMPQFEVRINYRLSCYLDDRVAQAKLAAVPMADQYKVHQQIKGRRQDLERILAKCARFGLNRVQAETNLQNLNDTVWNIRSFFYWARNQPDADLMAKYGGLNSVPVSQAIAALERRYPEAAERNRRIAALEDVPDLERDGTLLELKTEDEVTEAQLEFTDCNDVEVLPTGQRYYPYRSAAAQTIGWVGGATQPLKAFANDPLASYQQGEVCGREDGVEYVCESILRGRRGEVAYDIDKQLIRQTESQLGRDVQLTLDIDLQERIERRILDPQLNPAYCRAPTAAVVLDVRSGEILALVSLPSFDLNGARDHYGKLLADPNRPTVNRTIYRHYPPGSVAKPAILIAGLESGAITAQEPISCPAAEPPAGWPRCLIYRRSHTGHDSLWTNTARNATKGSCNVYFSRLAASLDAPVLQQWLLRFGYGREIPLDCPVPPAPGSIPRRLRQWPGEIGSTLAAAHPDGEIPPLLERDRKMFGIGQGNFRVTPLQVANAFATLARGGRFLPPRLFLSPAPPAPAEPVDLPIAPATLDVVRDGMSAVVNEQGGTAYTVFAGNDLGRHGVKLYGKTGSTEGPDNAWFAGFAQDTQGAKIALAVVVEGGQHGGSDAGTLARAIFEYCVEAGYVGSAPPAAR